jgi:signal transduction histidine kinase
VKPLSLRWKFFLLSGAMTLVTIALAGAMLTMYAFDRFQEGAKNHLEKQCDEIVAVLSDLEYQPVLENFLEIASSSRFTKHRYFFEVSELDGHTYASSDNLGEEKLPRPRQWSRTSDGQVVSLETFPGAIAHSAGPFLVRSEQSFLHLEGGDRRAVIVQAAVSLREWRSEMLHTLANDSIGAAILICGVAVLSWMVTSMSLRPVATITRKASEITAQNLEERIPVQGRAAELDELARVLNEMLDRLSKSLRQTAEFSADAAHQLRTPLTRIRGKLEVMLRTEMSDTVRNDIESLHAEVVRVSRLCGRLLLLGRLELHSGEANSLAESVDLGALVEELAEQCRPMAHEHGVALKSDSSGAVTIRGNRVLLVEACLNLLDNAIRHTPPGGSVRVSAESRGSKAVLSFADTGCGIAVQDRTNIFRPFYRGKQDCPSGASDGFGLGLSIVRAIAELHSGHVDLVSSAADGSLFRITLPAASS